MVDAAGTKIIRVLPGFSGEFLLADGSVGGFIWRGPQPL